MTSSMDVRTLQLLPAFLKGSCGVATRTDMARKKND
jgi:hypothetical protein